ncbi:MAG: NAD(P)/FAD-dependent oxidoreductase [Patescibacteria group bacterium]|jgi:hypothetical protein
MATKSNKNYDIAVIGGGPAGMMASGRAGELGARVILLEKNKSLGIKLLMTGHGRCNITNKTDDIRKLVEKYGVNGKFLFSSFNKFGVEEIMEFFENRGMETKIEPGNRVLPVSDKAQDVLGVLIGYLKDSGVEVKVNSEIKEIIKKSKKIEKLILANGEEIIADKYIICTGGKSYPLTGSSGDGYKWLKKLGHEIVEPLPALTPIALKDKFVKELEGVSLKDVSIFIYKNNKKIESQIGEAIFTSDGMSGPLILNMSRIVGKNLSENLKLRVDFYPQLDFDKLDRKIQADFQNDNNKLFRNFLEKLLQPKLAMVILKLFGINPEKQVNLVTKEERKKLVHLLKEFDLEISGLGGFEKAMVTSGGVKLIEIDPKTMKSKLIDNLYLAGEILDLDGPTGGFNLQICWSTGYVAGESAVS